MIMLIEAIITRQRPELYEAGAEGRLEVITIYERQRMYCIYVKLSMLVRVT